MHCCSGNDVMPIWSWLWCPARFLFGTSDIRYASNLFKIVEKHLSTAHCLADDTELYPSFKPDSINSQNDAISAMNKCVADLRNWMITDRLMINDDRTEFLSVRTRQQLAKINTVFSITFGEYEIDPSCCVRNCDLWLDSQFSMSTHVTKLCNSAFYHYIILGALESIYPVILYWRSWFMHL